MLPPQRPPDERGRVQLVDVFVGLVVVVAFVALAPIFQQFTSMVAAEADPLTALVLRLVMPLIALGLIVSMGISARRRV